MCVCVRARVRALKKRMVNMTSKGTSKFMQKRWWITAGQKETAKQRGAQRADQKETAPKRRPKRDGKTDKIKQRRSNREGRKCVWQNVRGRIIVFAIMTCDFVMQELNSQRQEHLRAARAIMDDSKEIELSERQNRASKNYVSAVSNSCGLIRQGTIGWARARRLWFRLRDVWRVLFSAEIWNAVKKRRLICGLVDENWYVLWWITSQGRTQKLSFE